VEAKRVSEFAEDRDIIVMGDFNIPSMNDALFKAITSRGLKIPNALRGLEHGTNLEKDKRYDQILHYPNFPESFTQKGGVLDFFIDEEHIKELFPDGMTKTKFTFQISDHLPLWMQINTDISGFKLEQIVQG
jgi:endonuclease/exonuclease/phosphatase family metal-dependent hydrolase